jgi:hypothetical protein
MKYSLDRMHQLKTGRHSGRTVDVLVSGIGMIMVTHNETICLVVPSMSREENLKKEFSLLCKHHFQVVPKTRHAGQFSIYRYSSIIKIVTTEQWENGYCKMADALFLFDD